MNFVRTLSNENPRQSWPWVQLITNVQFYVWCLLPTSAQLLAMRQNWLVEIEFNFQWDTPQWSWDTCLSANGRLALQEVCVWQSACQTKWDPWLGCCKKGWKDSEIMPSLANFYSRPKECVLQWESSNLCMSSCWVIIHTRWLLSRYDRPCQPRLSRWKCSCH